MRKTGELKLYKAVVSPIRLTILICYACGSTLRLSFAVRKSLCASSSIAWNSEVGLRALKEPNPCGTTK